MVAGRRTVFLLPETSGDLAKSTNLECTHLMHAKLALFAFASFCLVLAAGCRALGIKRSESRIKRKIKRSL